MSAAPVVLNTLLTHPQRRRISHDMKMWVAGSPPAPSVITQFMAELNIQVQTAYGLTETYGPISTYNYDDAWDNSLSNEEVYSFTTTTSRNNSHCKCNIYCISYILIFYVVIVIIFYVCSHVSFLLHLL